MSQYSNSKLDLNPEDLQKIEELGKVFFTEEEVATFMKLPRDLFQDAVKDQYHPIHMHYYSGWRQSEFELRKLIMNSAIAGSTPAQNTILDIQKKAYANRLK